MKIIVYQYQNRMQFFTPAEGARLALQVTLSDGKVLVCVEGRVIECSAKDAAALAKDREPLEAWKFVRPWPAPGALATWAETVEQQLERLQPSVIPAGAEAVKMVDADALPEDRSFRDAWTLNAAGDCVVDMAAAREIHKDTLRALRAPKLEALDVEFMRALESGDTARCSAIAAEKQALRDATHDPAIAAAATPEALKAVLPAVLQ